MKEKAKAWGNAQDKSSKFALERVYCVKRSYPEGNRQYKTRTYMGTYQ